MAAPRVTEPPYPALARRARLRTADRTRSGPRLHGPFGRSSDSPRRAWPRPARHAHPHRPRQADRGSARPALEPHARHDPVPPRGQPHPDKRQPLKRPPRERAPQATVHVYAHAGHPLARHRHRHPRRARHTPPLLSGLEPGDPRHAGVRHRRARAAAPGLAPPGRLGRADRSARAQAAKAAPGTAALSRSHPHRSPARHPAPCRRPSRCCPAPTARSRPRPSSYASIRMSTGRPGPSSRASRPARPRPAWRRSAAGHRTSRRSPSRRRPGTPPRPGSPRAASRRAFRPPLRSPARSCGSPAKAPPGPAGAGRRG